MSDDSWGGWDDMDDIFYDPDNDFEEDLVDEHVDTEYAEFIDEELPIQEPTESEENKMFDISETIILGSMIVGSAIEESLDEKRRSKLLKSEEKNKK